MDWKRQKGKKQMSGKIQMLFANSINLYFILAPLRGMKDWFPQLWGALPADTPPRGFLQRKNHPAKHGTWGFLGDPLGDSFNERTTLPNMALLSQGGLHRFLPQLGGSLKGQVIFRLPWPTEAFCRLNCPFIFPQPNPASFPSFPYGSSQEQPSALHNNLHFGFSITGNPSCERSLLLLFTKR